MLTWLIWTLCCWCQSWFLNGMQIEPNVDNTEFELSWEFYLEDTTANLKIMTVLLPFLSCMIAKVSPSLSHAIPVHCLNQRKKILATESTSKIKCTCHHKKYFFLNAWVTIILQVLWSDWFQEQVNYSPLWPTQSASSIHCIMSTQSTHFALL